MREIDSRTVVSTVLTVSKERKNNKTTELNYRYGSKEEEKGKSVVGRDSSTHSKNAPAKGKTKGRMSRSSQGTWRQARLGQREQWIKEGGTMMAFRDRNDLKGVKERIKSDSSVSVKMVSLSSLQRMGCPISSFKEASSKVGKETKVPFSGLIYVVKGPRSLEQRSMDSRERRRFSSSNESKPTSRLGVTGLASPSLKGQWMQGRDRGEIVEKRGQDADASMPLSTVGHMQRSSRVRSPRMRRMSLLARYAKDVKDVKDLQGKDEPSLA